MIIIDEVRIDVSCEDIEGAILKKITKLLRIDAMRINSWRIRKRSIDARKKPQVFFLYQIGVEVENEEAICKRSKDSHIHLLKEPAYVLPEALPSVPKQRPVVVGFGPAGMFAAYLLAICGAAPIVIERGAPVEQRREDVAAFFATGVLNPDSNAQFGEGGAGTFSDGKLTTQRKDKSGRNRFVLETFCRFGADGDILIDAKPHIGTDRLITVVRSMREEIIRLGGEVRFFTPCVDLILENGRVCGVHTPEGDILTDRVILAVGHSARDTFFALRKQGIAMEAKAFAVGFRVEHPQELIQMAQYGSKAASLLPAAPYKLVTKQTKTPLYSFCMCPGGYVINASSETGRLCVNGMSEAARDGANANSALVMPYVPDPVAAAADPLVGISYQRQIEELAYNEGKGRIPQQLFGDFVRNTPSTGYGRFASETRGVASFGNLHNILNDDMNHSFVEGVREMGRYLKGFDDEEMILSGVESRTSSPVRIPRNERFVGSAEGLYPCGEGAGYAGGITSAAMDGMKTAEAVLGHIRDEI